jgi:hypothetical protein
VIALIGYGCGLGIGFIGPRNASLVTSRLKSLRSLKARVFIPNGELVRKKLTFYVWWQSGTLFNRS